MKGLSLIFFSLAFVACNQGKMTKNLVIEDLKYSAYYMHFNEKVDSFEFYLVHYLEIDKNGKFVLMRHDNWMGKPKYFKGAINDTIRQHIDTIFYYDTFKTDYSYDVNKNGTYAGFTYCLDYQQENNFKKKIQFIPGNSPDQIKALITLLDTLVYDIATLQGDSLNLKNYTEQLEELYISKQGRIPKPQKPPPSSEKLKFSK